MQRREDFDRWRQTEMPESGLLRWLSGPAEWRIHLLYAVFVLIFAYRILRQNYCSLQKRSSRDSRDIAGSALAELRRAEASPPERQPQKSRDPPEADRAPAPATAPRTRDKATPEGTGAERAGSAAKSAEAERVERREDPDAERRSTLGKRKATKSPPTDATLKRLKTDPAIARRFLDNMSSEAESYDAELTRSIDQASRHGVFVHNALFIAAIGTLAVASLCAYLVIARGIGLGLVSGAIGLLTGAGTLLLRRMSSQIAERERDLSRRRVENLNALRAIQATQMISDSAKRDTAIEALAERFGAQALERSGQ
jgi:hypothetical protein